MARRARPPFPINLIWNVKAFYVTFIVVMIASLAATGLATGLGSSGGGSSPPPIEDDSTVPVEETPTGLLTFDGPEDTIDASQPHKAIIRTDRGDIEIELATDAPEAVNNFAFLAGKGFYNELTFFYVDKRYFAQAGDPACESSGEHDCSGNGSAGYDSLPLVEGSASHEQWAVVAPAIIEGQEVHGSQFRILSKEDPRLDGKETVFGKVVGGQEILEGLEDFVPCSVAQTDDCDPEPDMSSALVIKEVIVEPA